MAHEDFPLPEVADALEPFIKPREEVTLIRQELQKHVQRQLKTGDIPLTVANLTTAPEGDLTDFSSPPLTGVRRAYLKALQAHAAAQSRFDSLKADLAKLQRESEGPFPKTGINLVNDSYIPLLRQKERQRKLLVLDRTFAQVNAAGKGVVDGHLDDIVKRSAGDLPTPPLSQPPSFSDKPDVNARILELKKAVLTTKRSVEDVQNGKIKHRPRSDASSRSSSEADVAGLQRALNELTGWMEHQLAIIGEADGTNSQSAPSTTDTNGHTDSQPANLEHVEQLYEQYIAARQHLIDTVNNPPSPELDSSPSSPVLERSAGGGSNNANRAPAELLLPYIPNFTAHKEFESSLLQQSAHLRKAISSAERETQRLISRLADESHLVHPGASHGADWEAAGAEAGKATVDAAMQRIKIGEEYAKDAEKKIAAIEGLPGVFDGLDGEGR